MATRLKRIWPAMVTLFITGGYLIIRLSGAGWDPSGVAEVGSRYLNLDSQGEQGYDGQFAYFMALDLDPESVAPHLDVPAYRYQRILYPLSARFLSFTDPEVIPWMLMAINLGFHALATWGLAKYFDYLGLWTGYALVYGLWVGLVAGVGLDLHEPLAYGLIVFGLLACQSGRSRLGAVFIVTSLFAKETSIFFWVAALFGSHLNEDDRSSTQILLAGGAIFLVWQIWLYATFGQVGIASGGDMATGFEWLPLMGFFKIGGENLRALALYAVIFIPSIILPVVWGTFTSIREITRGWRKAEAWALLFNAMLVLFLPFSTFREPLGLVRVATGFVLAMLVYSGSRKLHRPLNYSMFWIPMLVILIPR